MNKENFIEIIPVAFSAGESRIFHVSGSYFEVIDCPTTVDVILQDSNGAQRGRMIAAEASFNLNQTQFDTIQITSAVTQNIRFAFGSGLAGTRRASGAVSILNKRGTFTQAQATAGVASANIAAANASRNYLLIQNKDTALTVFVNLSGAAATAANSIAITPGASLELSQFVPTGAVTAISSGAANSNVIISEA